MPYTMIPASYIVGEGGHLKKKRKKREKGKKGWRGLKREKRKKEEKKRKKRGKGKKTHPIVEVHREEEKSIRVREGAANLLRSYFGKKKPIKTWLTKKYIKNTYMKQKKKTSSKQSMILKAPRTQAWKITYDVAEPTAGNACAKFSLTHTSIHLSHEAPLVSFVSPKACSLFCFVCIMFFW